MNHLPTCFLSILKLLTDTGARLDTAYFCVMDNETEILQCSKRKKQPFTSCMFPVDFFPSSFFIDFYNNNVCFSLWLQQSLQVVASSCVCSFLNICKKMYMYCHLCKYPILREFWHIGLIAYSMLVNFSKINLILCSKWWYFSKVDAVEVSFRFRLDSFHNSFNNFVYMVNIFILNSIDRVTHGIPICKLDLARMHKEKSVCYLFKAK